LNSLNQTDPMFVTYSSSH